MHLVIGVGAQDNMLPSGVLDKASVSTACGPSAERKGGWKGHLCLSLATELDVVAANTFNSMGPSLNYTCN